MAKDIVRILQDQAEIFGAGMEYHYGKKAALNLLDGTLEPEKIFFLHEFTNRKNEYNSSGTAIASILYEGKFFLVKHSDYDQHNGTDVNSKYTTNIEPLLTTFANIGNRLGCMNLEVLQWDNIDVTDALDANMDGLLCSYKIRVRRDFE